jgi:hypothetical protein
VASVTYPVRRDESRWRETAQGAGDAERPAETHHGRSGARYRHVEASQRGRMVTPNRRHQAGEALENEFGVSQRGAYRVGGQPQSTHRLPAPVPCDDEAEIRVRLRAFSKRRPRWGWRRAVKRLRDEGHHINDKRVRRLWRDEGLRVPQHKCKKRLTGIGVVVGAMIPICPSALWAHDQDAQHHRRVHPRVPCHPGRPIHRCRLCRRRVGSALR